MRVIIEILIQNERIYHWLNKTYWNIETDKRHDPKKKNFKYQIYLVYNICGIKCIGWCSLFAWLEKFFQNK